MKLFLILIFVLIAWALIKHIIWPILAYVIFKLYACWSWRQTQKPRKHKRV